LSGTAGDEQFGALRKRAEELDALEHYREAEVLYRVLARLAETRWGLVEGEVFHRRARDCRLTGKQDQIRSRLSDVVAASLLVAAEVEGLSTSIIGELNRGFGAVTGELESLRLVSRLGFERVAREVKTGSQHVASEVRAGAAAVGREVRAGSDRVAGEVRAGSHRVAGEVRAGSHRVAGEVRAGSHRVAGEVRAGSDRVAGEVRAGSDRVAGEVRAGSHRVAGEVRAGAAAQVQAVQAGFKESMREKKRLRRDSVGGRWSDGLFRGAGRLVAERFHLGEFLSRKKS